MKGNERRRVHRIIERGAACISESIYPVFSRGYPASIRGYFCSIRRRFRRRGPQPGLQPSPILRSGIRGASDTDLEKF